MKKIDFYKKNITNIVQSTTKSTDIAAESAFIEKATNSMVQLDEYERTIATTSGKAKKDAKKALKEAFYFPKK